MKKINTIDEMYDITTAFITDKNSVLDKIDDQFYKIRQVIFGATYTLTIHTPQNADDYIIHHGIGANTTKFQHAIKHGPLGEISLCCEGRLIAHSRTKHPIAPAKTNEDNFIKQILRKIYNRNFHKIVDFAKSRHSGKIILRDNSRIINEILFNIKQNKQK